MAALNHSAGPDYRIVLTCLPTTPQLTAPCPYSPCQVLPGVLSTPLGRLALVMVQVAGLQVRRGVCVRERGCVAVGRTEKVLS